MRTLLIVEDEYQIRENTAAFIRQRFPSLSVLTSSNGADALELLTHTTADAMLLDIKMKHMDGLTLLHNLKTRGITLPTVIVSGHSDFEYAKTAIGYGVIDYLVKPFTPDAIENIVSNLLHLIDEQQAQENLLAALRTKVLENTAQLRNDLFYAWISGNIEEQTLLKKSAFLNILWDKPFYQVYIIQPQCNDDAENETQRLFIRKTAEDLSLENVQIFSTYDGIILLHGMDSSEKLLEQETLQPFLTNLINAKILIGCGLPHKGLPGIGKSYLQALNALRSNTQCPHSAVLPATYEEKKTSRTAINSFSFILALQQSDTEYIQKELDLYKNSYSEEENLTFEEAENLCVMVLSCCRSALGASLSQADGIPTYGQFVGKLAKFTSIEEMLEYAQEIALRTAGNISRSGKQKTQLLQITRRYIEQNYATEITVALLAREIGVNPDYLGKLFKKEYGESINSYINRVRIQKAITLFQTTLLNISEVADAVGFRDQTYFSSVFKKIVGDTPSSFRKHGSL